MLAKKEVFFKSLFPYFLQLSPLDKVKAVLQIKGKNLAMFAEEINVSRSGLNNVLHGHYYVERIALAIVEETEVPFEELWPERTKPKHNASQPKAA
jgi:lambda repressor-like predicted transcriptional regulator